MDMGKRPQADIYTRRRLANSETLTDFEAASWVGMVAPAATPAPILAKLHKEVTAVLADKDVSERLIGQGFDIVGSSPAEFLAFAKAESARLGKIIANNKIKVE